MDLLPEENILSVAKNIRLSIKLYNYFVLKKP